MAPRHTRLRAYAGAALAVGVALFLRWEFPNARAPNGVVVLAVFLVALVGGTRAGLLATALGGAGIILLALASPSDVAPPEILRFLGGSFFFLALCEALHRARRRAAQSGERLATSEARFQAALTSIGDAVIVADLDGRVTFLNPVAEALTGWDAASAIGEPLTTVFQLVDEDTRRPTAGPASRVRAIGTAVGLARTVLIARGGSERPVEASAAPVMDAGGASSGVVMVFRDATERRRAEAAAKFLTDAGATLADLTDYHSTLQKVASLAVPAFADWCVVDLADEAGTLRREAIAHRDPAKVELTQEYYRRFPPDPDEAGGAAAVWRTGQPELVADLTDEMLVEGVKDEEHLRLLRGLGLKSYLCVPLQATGKSLGVITFVSAESGRSYGPADLALAGALAQRAAVAVENARLYAALVEEGRRKDEFLAMLAHELRNPLAPIRTAAEVLRRKGDDPATVARASGMLERQAAHLSRLVDDLLDASRIARGQMRLRPERLDLTELVRTGAEDQRPELESAGLTLAIDVPGEPVWVEGDRTRLAQVVGNLLHNAVKFSEPGGVVSVRLTAGAGRAVMEVRDTGIGIAPEMLSRVFDVFAQADRSLERSRGGLGLGLALVKGLAEAHGGSVRAASDGSGRGAAFTVELPLAETAAEPPAAAPAAGTARRRVLVVEDSKDAADILRMLLEAEGHEVAVAYTGPEGVEAALSYRPEVVLCDLGLPGYSGYEVAKRLRQDDATARARLVAVTGYGHEEDRRRSREAGFDAHFVKPVDPDALGLLLEGRPGERGVVAGNN